MSGSDYPTANLYLVEICKIKEILDAKSSDRDQFIAGMVAKMKMKFDKYWGECNLLMSIAAILDPRLKMLVIDHCFPKIYPSHEVRQKKEEVRVAIYALYTEYEKIHSGSTSLSTTSRSNASVHARKSNPLSRSTGMSQFITHISSVESVQPHKNELDAYFEDGQLTQENAVGGADLVNLDALKWWKEFTKYKILSKMVADILAVPVSTVASEATFSARTRVIDTYRSSLAPDTVEMMMCTGDWCRKLHGIKKKDKKSQNPLEIVLPKP